MLGHGGSTRFPPPVDLVARGIQQFPRPRLEARRYYGNDIPPCLESRRGYFVARATWSAAGPMSSGRHSFAGSISLTPGISDPPTDNGV